MNLRERLEKWAFQPLSQEKFEGRIEMLARLMPLIEAAQGCSDGNCRLRDRDFGQHTNGGCRCKRNVQSALAQLEKELE